MPGAQISNPTIGRIVGGLFLAAFACYGVGTALVDHPAGLALVLLNSVVVATIGGLVYRVFRRRHRRTATTYLLTRAIEAALLATGVFGLTSMGSAVGNDLAYQLAMLILGVGSLPFCWALQRDRFVPVWLAVWGVVGYVVLAAGAVLELTGLSVGPVLSIPGGLFEVSLGFTLIARGFPDRVTLAAATGRYATKDRLGASA